MNSTSLDFNRILFKKVISFVRERGLQTTNDFTHFKSVCYVPNDPSYRKHLKTFSVDAPISIVWNTYKSIAPQDAWQGDMLRFGFMYSRTKNNFTYHDDIQYEGIKAGHVLVLNLRLLGDLFTLAVGHEVKEVNDQERFIRICYMENGKSEGSQFIRLSALPDGHTQIMHETFYKSNSWIRDVLLYPSLHTKAITEFHHNVKRKIEQIGKAG
jgi:hypothetical protein